MSREKFVEFFVLVSLAVLVTYAVALERRVSMLEAFACGVMRSVGTDLPKSQEYFCKGIAP